MVMQGIMKSQKHVFYAHRLKFLINYNKIRNTWYYVRTFIFSLCAILFIAWTIK